jgi:hypothetical protein
MRKTLHTIAFTFSAIFFLTTLSFLENVHVGFKGSDQFLAEIKNIFPELSLDNAEMRFLPEPHLYFNKLAYEKKYMVHEVKFIPGFLQGYKIEAVKLTSSQQEENDILNYPDSFRALRALLIQIDNIVKSNSGIIRSIHIKNILLAAEGKVSNFLYKQTLDQATIDFKYNDKNISVLTGSISIIKAEASSVELSLHTDLLKENKLGKSNLDFQLKSLYPYDSVFTCVSFSAEKIEANAISGLNFQLPSYKNPYLSTCFELQEYEIKPGDSALKIGQNLYELDVTVDNKIGSIKYKPRSELTLDLEPKDNYISADFENELLNEFSDNLAMNVEIQGLQIGLKKSSIDIKIAAISLIESLKFKDNRVILKSKVKANPAMQISDFSFYFAGSSLTTEKLSLKAKNGEASLFSNMNVSINPSRILSGSSGYLNGKLAINCKSIQRYACNNSLRLFSNNIVLKSADITKFYNSISPALSSIWGQDSDKTYTKFSQVFLGVSMEGSKLRIDESNVFSERGSFKLTGNYDISGSSGIMQLRVLPFSDGNWYSEVPVIKGIVETALKATMELGVVLRIKNDELEIKDVSIGSALNEINEALINR